METQPHSSDLSNNQMRPRDLINKHILEPEHRISEEEINSLKVGANAEGEEKIQELVNKKTAELDKRSGSGDLLNPYSILAE